MGYTNKSTPRSFVFKEEKQLSVPLTPLSAYLEFDTLWKENS